MQLTQVTLFSMVIHSLIELINTFFILIIQLNDDLQIGRRQVNSENGSDQNLETHLTDIKLEISNRGEQDTLGKFHKYMYSAGYDFIYYSTPI